MKIGLKTKILSISIFPTILLGIVVITLTLTTIKGALIDEIQDALRGTATATLAAYNQNPGDYRITAGGEAWKGYYNISESDTLVDNIKQNSGMDITFFYGSDRVITSALDSNGERIIGSPAGKTITQKVL
jgi:methyl-accepting chemotaxis protein